MTLEKVYDELMSRIDKIMSGEAGGSDNYNKLKNRPQINGKLLTGNKTSDMLNIAKSMTESQYNSETKDPETVYFLQEYPSSNYESYTFDPQEITWITGQDEWYSNQAYQTEAGNTITSVSAYDPVVNVTYELGDTPNKCTITIHSPVDPTTLESLQPITVYYNQPIGNTRIVKDGITYGNSIVYSGEEKVVGEYFGKPLYAKTYTGVTLPAASTTPASFPLGITGLSKIVKYEGVATDGTNTIALPMPSVLATSVVDIYISNGTCYIDAGSDRHNYTCDVTVYYTKTN